MTNRLALGVREIGFLVLFMIAASLAQAQSPPSAPATSSGSYQVTWQSQGAITYLEEKVGASGAWTTLSNTQYLISGTNYYMNFNKPSGEYSYRLSILYTSYYGGSYWAYSAETRVVVPSGPPPQVDTLQVHNTHGYEVRRGDFNNDGLQDLYVNRTSGGQPGNGALERFILQQVAGGNFSTVYPSASQAATAAGWPVVTVNIGLEDINLDGYADMVLGQLANVIGGTNDQVVYAPAQLYGTLPKGIKPVDSSFRKFLKDFQSWLGHPNYFEANAPVQQIPVYQTTAVCYDVYINEWYPYTVCYPVTVFVGYVYQYDFSGFSSSALQFKQVVDQASSGPLSSAQADTLKSILDSALGIPTGLGTAAAAAGEVIILPWPGATEADKNPWLARILFRISFILLIASIPGDTPNFTYFHYTTEVALPLILASGQLISSSFPYLVFITQDEYMSSNVAWDLLALPAPPQYAIVLFSREMGVGVWPAGPFPVQPRYGKNGGGREWTLPSPVPIGVPPRVILLGP